MKIFKYVFYIFFFVSLGPIKLTTTEYKEYREYNEKHKGNAWKLKHVWNFYKKNNDYIRHYAEHVKKTTFFQNLLPKFYSTLLNYFLSHTRFKDTILDPNISNSYVMSLAKATYEKLPSSLNLLKIGEKVALLSVLQHINLCATRIIRRLNREANKPKDIVIFGGIIDGGGKFYVDLLEYRINQIIRGHAKNKISITQSLIGDARAIVGSVAYTLHNLYSQNTEKQYAIGIDLGGTNIRAGMVNLTTLQVEGDIIKIPTFQNQEEKDKTKKFNKILRTNHYNQNTELCPSMLKDYKQLTQNLLERLCETVKKFNTNKVRFISLAIAGTILSNDLIKQSYNLPLTGVNCAHFFEKKLNIPTFIKNDVFCAGIGEMLIGHRITQSEFFIVGIGTGINGWKIHPIDKNTIF